MSADTRLRMIDASHASLSVRAQCDLLQLHRSRYYHKPRTANAEDLSLMLTIDKLHHQYPFYGSRKISYLLSQSGVVVNRKRVQRFMRKMGIEALYPKQRKTLRQQEHHIYPYLLRHLTIDRPNQVWSADITYIPMCSGFMYFIGIMDWYSRYLLSWSLSNTLDACFCVEALEHAIKAHEAPDICNTDQGVQFTGSGWLSVLTSHDPKIGSRTDCYSLQPLIWKVWHYVYYLTQQVKA